MTAIKIQMTAIKDRFVNKAVSGANQSFNLCNLK
jgi:hypothetical protein